MGKAFNLKNGTILLVTEAPGGLYNAAQLKKIAAISDSSMAIVKATEDQRLALFVKEAEAPKIAEELKAIGLGIRHYQDGLHQPTACIGELCPDHDQDALGSAMALSKELSEIKLKSPLKIGINGCASCCVPCHTLDISVVGDAGGYRIALGGKNSQLPEMASFMADNVPADKLALLLKKVVVLYQTHAEEGESLQEVMDRHGVSEFIAALAPYSQDAAAIENGDPFAAKEDTDDGLLSNFESLEDIGAEDSVDMASTSADLDLSGDDADLGLEGIETDLNLGDDTLDLSGAVNIDVEINLDAPEDLELESLDISDLNLESEEQHSTSGLSTFTPDDQLMEDTDFSLAETENPMELMEESTAVEEEDLSAIPVAEDELGVDFEAQLEESIEEEKTFRAAEAADENSRDRDEALSMLEGGLEEIQASDSEAPHEIEFDETATFAAAASTKQTLPPKNSSAPGSLTLNGMHVSSEDHLVLEFTNGALMTIAADKIPNGQKTLKFGSQVVEIDVLAQGYQVEADGISLFYPFNNMSVA